MNQHENQTVVDWAKRNLQNGFDANKSDVWQLGIIFFGGIFFLLSVCKIMDFFTSRNRTDINSLFNFTGIATFLLPIVCLIYMTYQRRLTAIRLDSVGVETRGGENYEWAALRSADFRTGSINYAQRINRVVLNFENGKAFVPVYFFPELLNLLKTIPVQKKFNGSDSAKALERLYLRHGIE